MLVMLRPQEDVDRAQDILRCDLNRLSCVDERVQRACLDLGDRSASPHLRDILVRVEFKNPTAGLDPLLLERCVLGQLVDDVQEERLDFLDVIIVGARVFG